MGVALSGVAGALEYFGVSVGIQTNGTVELLFYSLNNFFSHFTSYTLQKLQIALPQPYLEEYVRVALTTQ